MGIDLPFADFADQASLGQTSCEMLGQAVVLRAGGASEMIKAQAEALRDLGLHFMHLGAVIFDGFTRFGGGQFGGGAMLIRGAEEQDLIAARAHVSGIKIGRKLASDQIAQMLDPVNIGNCRSDEYACHELCPACLARGLAHQARQGQM